MRRALVSLAAAVAGIAGGGVAFAASQHVSVWTGWYWALVTASTVGYGDIVPRDTAARWTAVAVILTAIPLLANAYSHLHVHRSDKRGRKSLRELLEEHRQAEEALRRQREGGGGD